MIAETSNRGVAESTWMTDRQVGKLVSAMLSDLAAFDGPMLILKSRKQIGLPG
jgi:hypothetical protein